MKNVSTDEPLNFFKNCTDEEIKCIYDYIVNNDINSKDNSQNYANFISGPNSEEVANFFKTFKRMKNFRQNLIESQDKENIKNSKRRNNSKDSKPKQKIERVSDNLKKINTEKYISWNDEDKYIRMIKCLSCRIGKDQIQNFEKFRTGLEQQMNPQEDTVNSYKKKKETPSKIEQIDQDEIKPYDVREVNKCILNHVNERKKMAVKSEEQNTLGKLFEKQKDSINNNTDLKAELDEIFKKKSYKMGSYDSIYSFVKNLKIYLQDDKNFISKKNEYNQDLSEIKKQFIVDILYKKNIFSNENSSKLFDF